jgi:rhodanese-related sulfurtransferase
MLPTEVSAAKATLHVLDVREQDEWDAGHIEGSVHIPLGELGDRLGELPADKVIVCVCRMGGRSEAAQRGLTRLGLKAENLDGGVQAWVQDGLPLITAQGGRGQAI